MRIHLLTFILLIFQIVYSQCPTCGNGVIDAGETNINCPQDVPQPPTCASCGQPGTYDPNTGIRQTWDFVGTTTYGASSLPTGWSFGTATSTTTGTTVLPTSDAYGAKGGLVQPNHNGTSFPGNNYFCIGNIGNLVTSGSQKLGGNFDGRPNVTQNSSYAILRGQGNPCLISPTFNNSSVQSFKIQFWLSASESSCGQGNGWGSCVGNSARLDFSADGGATWSLGMVMNTSSANSDMCTHKTSNTFWIQEGRWHRVCVTVFRSSTSPGNFYSSANANSAPSGIMVNSAYFTNNFKFRIVYLQTASCTNVSATNPGRYLAIDYPVFTNGNEVIPCGISFLKMCGYGEDNNDDNVGSSTAKSTAIAFGTVRRGVHQAERGVEIFTSQNAIFQSNNANGTAFPSDFSLCNAEGSDALCTDWTSNNNSYFIIYECLTDFEPTSGNVVVFYKKNGTPQSFHLSKVTGTGKTALRGWRWSGSRFINCANFADVLPGCGGYHFGTTSLPLQFIRGFYGLSITSLGDSYAYYGANSCTHYFNGPFISPKSLVSAPIDAPNYIKCSGSAAVFSGLVSYCQNGTAFSGSPSISVYGPDNPSALFETIPSGGTGSNPVLTPGEYIIIANPPSTPTLCLDCKQSVCINLTAQDIIDLGCSPAPIWFEDFRVLEKNQHLELRWKVQNGDILKFQIFGGNDFQNLTMIQEVTYNQNIFEYSEKISKNSGKYFQIRAITRYGNEILSSIQEWNNNPKDWNIYVSQNQLYIQNPLEPDMKYVIYDVQGKEIAKGEFSEEEKKISLGTVAGMMTLQLTTKNGAIYQRKFLNE